MTLVDESVLRVSNSNRSKILFISACSACVITFGYFYLKKNKSKRKEMINEDVKCLADSNGPNISCVQQTIQKFEQKKEAISPQITKEKGCDSQTCIFNHNNANSFITPEIEMNESLNLLEQIKNNPHRLLDDKIVKIRLNNMMSIYGSCNQKEKTKIIELLVQLSKHNSIRKHLCLTKLIEILRDEFIVNMFEANRFINSLNLENILQVILWIL